MGAGSQRAIRIVKEKVPGTTPDTPRLRDIRNTGGSGISNERTQLTSNEFRSDRQIITSRLGNNQPAISIPVEFCFNSFDDFLAGGVGSQWNGGAYISLNTSVASNGVLTLPVGEDFSAHNIYEGCFIVLDSVENKGIYRVGSVSDNEATLVDPDDGSPVTLTVATETVTMYTGHYYQKIDASSSNITLVGVDSTMEKVGGDSFISLGVRVGDSLYISGCSTSGNNGWKTVGAVEDRKITFANAIITNETITTGDVEITTSAGLLKSGVDLNTFTIEEAFEDINEYHNVTGAKVGSMSMSFQPDAMITGEFALQAQGYNGLQKTAIPSSVIVPANTNNVFDSYTGGLTITGGVIPESTITGFDFSIDNALERRFPLGQRNASSIGVGRLNCTGNISAYFPDGTLARMYDNETIFGAEMKVVDLFENGYIFGWPKLKFSTNGREATENDVTQSLAFQALGGDMMTTMFIIKQPAII